MIDDLGVDLASAMSLTEALALLALINHEAEKRHARFIAARRRLARALSEASEAREALMQVTALREQAATLVAIRKDLYGAR